VINRKADKIGNKKAILPVAPDQGKGLKSFRRPATVIGTKAAKTPLSERMGRRGK
jgi:hypothetical protein